MRKLLPVLLAAALAASCQVLPRKMKSTAAGPPDARQMAELWSEPADPAARDLFHGPGGAEWLPAPGARFQFLARDTSGYSWGFDLKDERGVEWSAKYGPEAQPEVTVSRLVWAMGYHQPPTYYLARWTLVGSDDVPQASRFRPLPPGWRKLGTWELHRNPFVGTTPFNGLLVLMRVVNNWDLLDRNTALYEVADAPGAPRRRYLIQDLGASLGHTGSKLEGGGSRNDIDGFERQDFIEEVKDGRVGFAELGRTHRGLYRDIPAADVRWICERLSRLTDAQWQDAFRAGGYEPALAARFLARIKKNVAAGLAVSG